MKMSSIKSEIRERDNYCCVRCGMTNDSHCREFGIQLHVHRIMPGSRYSLDGCISVCVPCHRGEHRRLRLISPPTQAAFIDDDDRIMLTHETIRRFREVLGINLREFGELVGVSEATASRWEAGKRHPTWKKMNRLNQIAKERGIDLYKLGRKLQVA